LCIVYCYNCSAQQVGEKSVTGLLSETKNIWENHALKIAQVEAAYLKKKYGLDDNMEAHFASILYKKSLEINSVIHKNLSSENLDKQLFHVISRNDSVLQNYLRQASAYFYLSKKINTLDSIKPLNDQQRNKLTHAFLGAVKKSREDSYPEVFKTAMQSLADTIYFGSMYKKWIEKNSSQRTEKSIAKSKQPQRISASTKLLYFNYHKALITSSYTYPSDSRQGKLMTEEIEKYFRPLLDSALMRNGALIEKSLISAILTNNIFLKISVEQRDSLLVSGDRLVKDRAHFLHLNPGLSYKHQKFERRELARILTADQYTRLLKAIYTKDAQTWAESQWKEVENYSLIDKSDSIGLKKQLMNYHLNKLIVKERYADDLPLQASHLGQIELNKPKIVKLIDAARKSPQKADALAGKLTW
jgi:hypothetical protein